MADKCVLEIKGISKSFPGVKALNNVQLSVKPGTVHALVGENGAGKSTLMKIIGGFQQPDEGTIYFKGEPVTIKSPQFAMSIGISMIHQELNPIYDMSIAENIFLGREPYKKNKSIVDFQTMYEETKQLLEKQKLSYDPRKKLRELNIADMQMIEIIKAISRNSSLIIMDEPTSALTENEVQILFDTIRELKKQGIGIIYISHRMEEIFEIADEVTVFRDGQYVGNAPIEELTSESIVSMMVGREINEVFPKTFVPIGKEILRVEHLTGEKFTDVSFSVKEGEILGISGLMGAGRTEIVRAIFGLDPIKSGEIYLDGKPLKIHSARDAIKNGIAMVSEDRKRYGLVLCRSILENTSLPYLKRFSAGPMLKGREEKKEVQSVSGLLRVKATGIDVETGTLSGGNQQKVVLCKWLMGNPKVLILDEPTRGIDVGSKSEIHQLMCEFASKGMAVIMISSELPEILGMSDRILVMSQGRLRAALSREEASQERIMTICAGGEIHDQQ